jgi:hypothetical protein
MHDNQKTAVVLIGLSFLFLALHFAFQSDLWGRPQPLIDIPLVDPTFTNTATVRQSTAQLKQTGGDTSGVECYTCHERTKLMQLHYDTNRNLVLPKEHQDLTIRHGRNNRNNTCFNCHSQTNLETLLTRDGRTLKIEESTLLCANCHGPTYRDWEIGVHGRVSGFWDRSMGPVTKQDCVSCHDPHNPEFPSRKPAPRPHPLHPNATASRTQAKEH